MTNNEYSIRPSHIEVDLNQIDQQYKQYCKIREEYEADIKAGKVPKVWYRCNYCGCYRTAKRIHKHLHRHEYICDTFNLLKEESIHATEFKGIEITTPLLINTRRPNKKLSQEHIESIRKTNTRPLTEQWKKNIGKGIKGCKRKSPIPFSESHILAISKGNKGKHSISHEPLSKTHKLAISKSNKGKHSKPLTEQWKQHLSEAHLGKSWSEKQIIGRMKHSKKINDFYSKFYKGNKCLICNKYIKKLNKK